MSNRNQSSSGGESRPEKVGEFVTIYLRSETWYVNYQSGIRPKDNWRPKSGDERVVPMSDQLRKTLQEIQRNTRWVFCARVSKRHVDFGKQLSERRLLANLKQILSSLGQKGHLHTFRHSFISFAANGGTPERILRKWIGHVDREILDWYYHLATVLSH